MTWKEKLPNYTKVIKVMMDMVICQIVYCPIAHNIFRDYLKMKTEVSL